MGTVHNRNFQTRSTPAILFALLCCLLSIRYPIQITANEAAFSVNQPTVFGHASRPNAEVNNLQSRLPLAFERNEGQFDERVTFASRGFNYSVYLTHSEAVLKLVHQNVTIRMQLVNADRAAKASGDHEVQTLSNYFVGADPASWRSGVRNFERVVYSGVYPGVDLVYYGKCSQLEYDLRLAPGANPSAIGVRYSGADQIRVGINGELLIKSKGTVIRQQKPVAFQEIPGIRRTVPVKYVLDKKTRVRFAVGRYDRRHPLIIDPVLVYGTYLGGSEGERIRGIATDAAGNTFVTGETSSEDFPFTERIGTFRPATTCVFVSKLNSSGDGLIYSTLIGGDAESFSFGYAIATDTSGNAYVTGHTNALDFPTTPGAFQRTPGHSEFGQFMDAFILKLNTGGGLIYSTYLGGGLDDVGKSIAVDLLGNACVTGQTNSFSDFPTSNALQPHMNGFLPDAFLTKLNANGTALIYSTFLGGAESESGNGVAVDSAGNAYVTGSTSSSDFPNVNAFQRKFAGRSGSVSNDAGSNWSALGDSFPLTTPITAITFDPSNSAVITVGTARNGIYRSTDSGVNWFAINNGIVDLANDGFPGFYNQVNDIEIDRNNPATLYVGMGRVYRSTDGGNQWSHVTGGFTTSVKIDPTDSATVYAADNLVGVLQSTDSGDTWDELDFAIQARLLAISTTHPFVGYAARQQGGLAVIRPGGNVIPLPFPQSTIVEALAVDPINPMIVYAGAADGLHKSTDGGVHWFSINNGLAIGALTARVTSLAIDPQIPTSIYAGSSIALFKSTDAGASWTKTSLPVGFVYDIAIDSHASPHVLIGAGLTDDAFVSKINPSGQAINYSTYVGGTDIDVASCIAADPEGNTYIAGGSVSSSITGLSPRRPRAGGRSDAFVLKLGATGAPSYLTYVGGSANDNASGIATDATGNCYLAGSTTSEDFPTTPGALAHSSGQCINCTRGFVTKIDRTGAVLLYSSYVDGSDPNRDNAIREIVMGIAVDAASSIHIGGWTLLAGMPVTTNAFDTTFGGSLDGFIAKLNLFDICMQDDTNGNLLRFNSQTGDYLFSNCRKGKNYGGQGTVTGSFCKITLTARTADQVLTAFANTCTKAASAQLVTQGTTLLITDKDISNNSGSCR